MDRTRARRRGQEVLGIAIFLLGLGVAATIAVHLIPLEDGSTASNVAALVLLGIPFALVAEIVLFNNSLADVVAWLGFMSIVDLVAQTGGSRERYGPVLLHILSAGPSNGMHQRRPPFVVGIVLCAALLVSVWLGHGVNISGFGPRVAQPAHSLTKRSAGSDEEGTFNPWPSLNVLVMISLSLLNPLLLYLFDRYLRPPFDNCHRRRLAGGSEQGEDDEAAADGAELQLPSQAPNSDDELAEQPTRPAEPGHPTPEPPQPAHMRGQVPRPAEGMSRATSARHPASSRVARPRLSDGLGARYPQSIQSTFHR